MTDTLHIHHLQNYLTFYYEYLPKIKEDAEKHDETREVEENREEEDHE